MNYIAYYSNGALYKGHRALTMTETRERAERFIDSWRDGPVTVIAVIGYRITPSVRGGK